MSSYSGRCEPCTLTPTGKMCLAMLTHRCVSNRHLVTPTPSPHLRWSLAATQRSKNYYIAQAPSGWVLKSLVFNFPATPATFVCDRKCIFSFPCGTSANSASYWFLYQLKGPIAVAQVMQVCTTRTNCRSMACLRIPAVLAGDKLVISGGLVSYDDGSPWWGT